MHGQIYDDYRIILDSNPTKYLIWNKFFINICQNISKKPNIKYYNIGYRINNYKVFKKRKSKKILNLLFLEEDHPNSIELISYYASKFSNLGFNCFIKGKNNNDKLKSLPYELCENKNLFQTIEIKNIDLVFGISSNALFECYLLDVLSVSFGIKDQLLFNYQRKYDIGLSISNMENIDKKIRTIESEYDYFLNYYKKRIWYIFEK